MYKNVPFIFVKKCTKVFNFSRKKRMYKNVQFFLETIYILYKMYKMYNVVTLNVKLKQNKIGISFTFRKAR